MGISKQRPLPPDLYNDEDLLAMPDDLFRTAVGLRMLADDHGRGTCTDWMVRPELYRGRPEVTEDTLVDHMLRLDDLNYIGIYSAGDRTFYAMRTWPAVSHPAASKFPPPPLEIIQRFAISPLEDNSAWERGRAGEGDESDRGTTSDTSSGPPSPFCRVHQPRGTREDCRHCGTARLAAKQWEQEQRRVAADVDD